MTAEKLKKAGYAVHLDLRDQYTPGWKFHDWELKGIPLRMEIGPKDVEKNQVTLVRRDNSAKFLVNDNDIVNEVGKTLEDIQLGLYAKAKASLDASITQADNYDTFKKTLNDRGGFIRACWCGDSECEGAVKDETGATIRTLPLTDEKPFAGCIRCGRPATKVAYFAKSY